MIIPMSVIWIVYFQSIRIIDNQTKDNKKVVLQQLKQAVDSELQLIQSQSILFSLDPRIIQIASANNPVESLKYTDYLNNIRSVLNGISITSSLSQSIKECYIYMKNSDMVCTPSGIYESRYFFEKTHNSLGYSFEQWQKTLSSSSGKFIVIPDSNGSTIAYINWINNQTEAGACVVTMLDSKHLQDILNNFNIIGGGQVGINDLTGSSVLPLANSNDFEIESLKNYFGSFLHQNSQGKQSEVWFIASFNANWVYTLSSLVSNLGQQTVFLKNLAVISSIISLMFCFMISYFLAKLNYRPLKTIFNMLKEKSGISQLMESDEVNYIQKATDSILSERSYLKDSLQMQKQNITGLYLERLLKGNYFNYQSIEESILSTDIKFTSDAFAVILIDVANIEEGIISDESIPRQLIIEKLEQNVDQTHNYYTLNADKYIVCLINFNVGNVADSRSSLTNTAYSFKDIIKGYMNIEPLIVISDIHYTYGGIHHAYEEALNIMSILSTSDEASQIVTSWEISSSENNSFMNNYIKEKEQKFLNLLVNGSSQQAINELEAIYIKAKENMSHIYIKYLLLDMSFTCVKAICLSPIKSSLHDLDNLEYLNDILKKIQRCSTPFEMKTCIIELIITVCDAIIKESNNVASTSLSDRVMSIIDDHYTDNNLCISFIASSLNMNPNYISSLYKKQTGETVLEAISRIRISKAKELLVNTKSSMNDITNNVGYNNTLAFFRTFKKSEGMTPAQYREIMSTKGKQEPKL